MPLSNIVSIALRKPAIVYNHGFLRATQTLLSSGVVVVGGARGFRLAAA